MLLISSLVIQPGSKSDATRSSQRIVDTDVILE